MQMTRERRPLLLTARPSDVRMASFIGARKHISVRRGLLAFWLLAIYAAPFAKAQPCPTGIYSTFDFFGAYGSCTLPFGLGTISNIRFIPSFGPTHVIPGAITVSNSYPQLLFSFGTGQPNPTDTGTFSMAYTLTLPAGSTANFAGLGVNMVSLGTSLTGVGSFCLNGVFTGLPPTSCSGTAVNVTSFGSPSGPTSGTVSFPAATSVDVFESVTAQPGIETLNPTFNEFQGFTINASPTPSPTPAPSSLLLALAGLACVGLYLVRRNFVRSA